MNDAPVSLNSVHGWPRRWFVSFGPLWPAQAGATIRHSQILDALEESWDDVGVLFITRDAPTDDVRRWAEKSRLPIMWMRSNDTTLLGRVRAAAVSMVRRQPYLVSVVSANRRASGVAEGAGLILAQGAASGFARRSERAQAVLLLCDFDPEYAHNQYTTETAPLQRLVRRINWSFSVRYYRKLYGDVRGVVTLSSDDEAHVNRLAPGAHVVSVPIALPMPPESEHAPTPSRLVFVGGGQRNIDSVRLSLAQVIPELRRLGVRTPLEIVGRLSDRDVQQVRSYAKQAGLTDDDVIIVGPVDNIGEYLSSEAVLLAPFELGAGVKVKCIDAMLRGALVATTTQGARGTPLIDGETGIVDDDLTALAAKIHSILDTPASAQIAAEGRNAARAQHDISMHRSQLQHTLGATAEADR